MVAKTGRVTAHWAHAAARDWDPWWETETEWHRNWKARFPEAWQEVPQTAADGEVHRADVLTPKGLTLEFQHSALRDDERASREAFHQQLVWIVDGRPFRENFEIYHPLPDPAAPIARDIVWMKAHPAYPGTQGGMYFRLSEFELEVKRPATKEEVTYGYIHGLQRIEEDVLDAHRGHYQFGWKHRRWGWLEAASPVYFDFGDNRLWALQDYDNYGLRCCRVTSCPRFVAAAHLASTTAELEALIWPASDRANWTPRQA